MNAVKIYISTAEALERITKQVAQIATFYTASTAYVEMTNNGISIEVAPDEELDGLEPDVSIRLEVDMIPHALKNASKILDKLYLDDLQPDADQMPWVIKTVEAMDVEVEDGPDYSQRAPILYDDEQANLDATGL